MYIQSTGACLCVCVCVRDKNTPPEKKMRGKSSFQSTNSGAGLQFLLLDCRAKACTKGLRIFTDTGIEQDLPEDIDT